MESLNAQYQRLLNKIAKLENQEALIKRAFMKTASPPGIDEVAYLQRVIPLVAKEMKKMAETAELSDYDKEELLEMIYWMEGVGTVDGKWGAKLNETISGLMGAFDILGLPTNGLGEMHYDFKRDPKDKQIKSANDYLNMLKPFTSKMGSGWKRGLPKATKKPKGKAFAPGKEHDHKPSERDLAEYPDEQLSSQAPEGWMDEQLSSQEPEEKGSSLIKGGWSGGPLPWTELVEKILEDLRGANRLSKEIAEIGYRTKASHPFGGYMRPDPLDTPGRTSDARRSNPTASRKTIEKIFMDRLGLTKEEAKFYSGNLKSYMSGGREWPQAEDDYFPDR